MSSSSSASSENELDLLLHYPRDNLERESTAYGLLMNNFRASLIVDGGGPRIVTVPVREQQAERIDDIIAQLLETLADRARHSKLEYNCSYLQ